MQPGAERRDQVRPDRLDKSFSSILRCGPGAYAGIRDPSQGYRGVDILRDLVASAVVRFPAAPTTSFFPVGADPRAGGSP